MQSNGQLLVYIINIFKDIIKGPVIILKEKEKKKVDTETKLHEELESLLKKSKSSWFNWFYE